MDKLICKVGARFNAKKGNHFWFYLNSEFKRDLPEGIYEITAVEPEFLWAKSIDTGLQFSVCRKSMNV